MRELGSFLCQPIGVPLSVAGEQAMSFWFAQIAAESIAVRADLETGWDGPVDLAGGPAGDNRSGVQ